MACAAGVVSWGRRLPHRSVQRVPPNACVNRPAATDV